MKKWNWYKGFTAFVILVFFITAINGQTSAGILYKKTETVSRRMPGNRQKDMIVSISGNAADEGKVLRNGADGLRNSVSLNSADAFGDSVSRNSAGNPWGSVSQNGAGNPWGSISQNSADNPWDSVSQNAADFLLPDWIAGSAGKADGGYLDEMAALGVLPEINTAKEGDTYGAVSANGVKDDNRAVSANDAAVGQKEEAVNLELPGDYLFYINPDGMWDDADRQIFSDEYEIINHSRADVRIKIHPYIVGGEFEWVGTPPEEGSNLQITEPDKKGAVYLVYRIGEHEIVMSQEETEDYEVILEGIAEDGSPSEGGGLKISFSGNVAPDGSYPEGEIMIRVDYSFEEAE